VGISLGNGIKLQALLIQFQGSLSWRGLCCGTYLCLNACQCTFYRLRALSSLRRKKVPVFIFFHLKSEVLNKKLLLAKAVCPQEMYNFAAVGNELFLP
jgi:hypothetical protein